MGFGAFSHAWDSSPGWTFQGGENHNGHWVATRTLISGLGKGVSHVPNNNRFSIHGGLFLSHNNAGHIQVELLAVSGANRPCFTRDASVPNIGDIHKLNPIPSPALEILFSGASDNNDWIVTITCEGLDRPGYVKIPNVAGWFGVEMMVNQP